MKQKKKLFKNYITYYKNAGFFPHFFYIILRVIIVNDFIIKTNNGRCIYLFDNDGLCMKDLTSYSNRYKLIYPESAGDFGAVDTGFGEIGVICQNKEGSIVFIKENDGEFIKTILLNSKNKIVYDKYFVILLHGRWIGISYIIEYKENNLLSFQIVNNENEPPMAVDYIKNKKYFTFVDNDYNRMFIYNKDDGFGYKAFKWSQKRFEEYEFLEEGELVTALEGFSDDCFIIFKKDGKNYLLKLKYHGINMIKETYLLDFIDKYDDLSLMLDKNILWIIAEKNDFVIAYKTDTNQISFSSQYNIFTEGKVKKIKTVLNDSDKNAVECFGTVKEYTPELLLYKDLKRCNYKAMLKQEDDNRNERIELKRTLEKIEIRLKLLEEKEREKKNSENKEQ